VKELSEKIFQIFLGTFKLQKIDLQKEAFDIEKIKEDSFYLLKEGSYVPLDKDLYDSIISGTRRL